MVVKYLFRKKGKNPLRGHMFLDQCQEKEPKVFGIWYL